MLPSNWEAELPPLGDGANVHNDTRTHAHTHTHSHRHAHTHARTDYRAARSSVPTSLATSATRRMRPTSEMAQQNAPNWRYPLLELGTPRRRPQRLSYVAWAGRARCFGASQAGSSADTNCWRCVPRAQPLAPRLFQLGETESQPDSVSQRKFVAARRRIAAALRTRSLTPKLIDCCRPASLWLRSRAFASEWR